MCNYRSSHTRLRQLADFRSSHTRLRQLADFPSLIVRSSFAYPSLIVRWKRMYILSSVSTYLF
ncbi:hypothetical protein [Capnocytophaga leadbetteri]|uniref:hypothetical protein n=1 Tax=Capnocytophaga leadbetteri TaxID=327575 RepID=UPI0028F11E50|nr:hypothetical protein [Capnocytophaga leadbetteri]